MSTATDTGRIAVITGASSGIGEATARALHADGYRVAVLARRAERIEALPRSASRTSSAAPTSWSTTRA